MARSKQKFREPWIYHDEATGKDHPIQVYTIVEDVVEVDADGKKETKQKIYFEAEVRTPDKFTDTDENANVLRTRVLARCAEGRTLVWVPYFLVTTHAEGFKPDLFAADGRRRYFGVSLLIEDVEVATLKSGETVWRGGKLSKFGFVVKPGWPPTGKTQSGGEACIVEDTPANRVALAALYKKFVKVGTGMRAAVNPKNITRNLKLLSTEQDDTHWKDFNRAYDTLVDAQAKYLEESPCQAVNEPSSGSSVPDAAAKSASPTASACPAT